MEPAVIGRTSTTLRTGDRVEVRVRFSSRWSPGFQVVSASPTGVRVRRLSDGAVLPAELPFEDVRPA